jgi:hypothetical protein
VPTPPLADRTDEAARPKDKGDAAARPTGAFASKTPGTAGAAHVTAAARAPGAGDYNPHAASGGIGACKTFSKANKAGAGGFGAKAVLRRGQADGAPDADAEYAPGPGSYRPDQKDARAMGVSAAASKGKVSSAFASGTLRSDWLMG